MDLGFFYLAYEYITTFHYATHSTYYIYFFFSSKNVKAPRLQQLSQTDVRKWGAGGDPGIVLIEIDIFSPFFVPLFFFIAGGKSIKNVRRRRRREKDFLCKIYSLSHIL